MERRLPITWVEVFAETPMSGNLLPVLHDADGLPASVLVLAARRFLQPETSFVQTATAPGASYRHRIFTIAGELAFAGHPSLGTAAAHAHRLGLARMDIVQETLSGLQPLRVELDGAIGRVSLRQNPPALGAEIDGAGILAALGVDPAAAHPALPAQLATTGLLTLILPLADPAALTPARFDETALRAALGGLPERESLNCYLVAEAGPGAWRARCFALDLTGGEDPATGSAAGPLGAFLQHHRGTAAIVVDQGLELGSPSRIEVDCSDGVVIAGATRIVGEGSFVLDAEARAPTP